MQVVKNGKSKKQAQYWKNPTVSYILILSVYQEAAPPRVAQPKNTAFLKPTFTVQGVVSTVIDAEGFSNYDHCWSKLSPNLISS